MAEYPTIDSELLRTFVAIADQGGFTRAAEALNRTQSAVSMQMKRLEEDVVKRSLFQRVGRQLELTPEGQVLLSYARRILKLQGEIISTARTAYGRFYQDWHTRRLCNALFTQYSRPLRAKLSDDTG